MTLPARFFCAPMAELTTPALRETIKGFGGGVVLCSEMLSAAAIVARSKHNEPLVLKREFEEPFGYQIVGTEPKVMANAARMLQERGCWAVDINMGCSAPDIAKTGAGARLLGNPDRAREIVRACRRAVSIKLSVKMRAGYDSSDPVRLVEFARMLESEGVDHITLHPRHGRLGFRRKADWKLVLLLKESLRIPVIGNGDIISPVGAVARLGETGCDAVMIGREAVKSPWIFMLCTELLAGVERVHAIDVREIFITVLHKLRDSLPAHLHKSRGHRFAFYFSKNAYFSHELFTRIRKETDIDGMARHVMDYYDAHPDEATLVIRPGKARDDAAAG
ncbi:MAG TPA: tRNA-dihydrouridine synthase family protein [Spirochaetota bacterium]|nr:tRNA-dihydrouridine synthase family protein [Spirochaetota bacterium]